MGQNMGCCGGRESAPVTTEKKPADGAATGTSELKAEVGVVAEGTKSRGVSVHDNASLWRKFFDQTMKSFARIGEKHMSLVGPTPPSEQQKQELETLVAEVKHEVRTNMNHLLGNVFDHYDKNKSNDLDEHELKAVVDDYVVAAQLVMDKCIRELFAPDGPMVRAALAAGARTGATPDATAREVAEVKAALVDDMKVLNGSLERCKTTSATLVKQLVKQFDTNGDGKISRSEFIDQFHLLATSLSVSGPLAA